VKIRRLNRQPALRVLFVKTQGSENLESVYMNAERLNFNWWLTYLATKLLQVCRYMNKSSTSMASENSEVSHENSNCSTRTRTVIVGRATVAWVDITPCITHNREEIGTGYMTGIL
jgi:hypothetical protein